MNSKGFKWISAIIATLLLLSIVYQVFQYFYNPYKTEIVFEYTVADTIQAKGIVARDETVISAIKQGTMQYYCENGTKVGKNSLIAKSYNSEDEVINARRIEQLTQEIEMLQSAQDKSSSTSLLPEAMAKQINDSVLAFVKKIELDELSDMQQAKLNYLALSNKRQITIGKQENYIQRIAQLQEEKKELESRIGKANGSVYAPASGYFANTIDGYEQALNTTTFDNITVEQFADLYENRAEPIESEQVGKIITSYEWKLVISVESRKLDVFKHNSQCYVLFSAMSDRPVLANIDQIITEQDGENSLVVLSGDTMTEEISTVRFDDVQIQFDHYTGLKVPKSAIRVEDNVKGVYTLLGDEIIYKKLDVIYETEEYAISKMNWNDSSYLKLYDGVIVEGKDLYDNKHI